MIRLTFDRYFIDDLDDYYRRNECIREQQYLSQEKLLHLAAFCVSKVANNMAGKGQSRQNAANEDDALNVIRQLSRLCTSPDQKNAPRKTIIVNGRTVSEIATREQNTTTIVSPTLVQKFRIRWRRLLTSLGWAISPVQRIK